MTIDTAYSYTYIDFGISKRLSLQIMITKMTCSFSLDINHVLFTYMYLFKFLVYLIREENDFGGNFLNFYFKCSN